MNPPLIPFSLTAVTVVSGEQQRRSSQSPLSIHPHLHPFSPDRTLIFFITFFSPPSPFVRHKAILAIIMVIKVYISGISASKEVGIDDVFVSVSDAQSLPSTTQIHTLPTIR